MDYSHEIILKVPTLYIDKFKNKYIYYNFEGNGNIIVIDKKMHKFISEFDGKRTIAEISFKYKLNLKEVNENIQTLIKKEILYIKNNPNVQPKKLNIKQISCWLHITNNCNLNCKYCYIHKYNGDMSEETYKKAINQMLKYCHDNSIEKINLKFAGGEPTTRLNFIEEIISFCENKKEKIKFNYSMITNGILLNDQLINLIKRYNISVGLSLDGLEKENDKNRCDINGKGSFRKVINNLKLLKKHQIKPLILTTITLSNIKTLSKFTKFLIRNNMNFRFSLERDYDNGKPKILKKSTKIIKNIKKSIKLMQNEVKKGQDFSFQFGDVYFNGPKNKVCAAGTTFFALGHDGNIGMCGMGLSKPLFNIIENNDLDFLNTYKEKTKELSNFNKNNISECKSCIWKNSCANACPLQTYATYQTYNHVSPYCKIYKKCLPEYLKLQGMFIYYKSIKGGEK